jgi:hypothetical protein
LAVFVNEKAIVWERDFSLNMYHSREQRIGYVDSDGSKDRAP